MTTNLIRREFLHIGFGGVAVMTAWPVMGAATPLKIGSIGAGRVAGALAKVWTAKGHQVMLSSRNPESLKGLVAELGPNASAGTVAQAVAFGDVILLAVPYTAVAGIAKDHGAALAKKPLILNASNPILGRDGDLAVQVRAQGVGPYTDALLPGAKIVRAFNIIGYPRMIAGGRKDGVQMSLPMSGDDKAAIAIASDLVRESGYEPLVLGTNADYGNILMPGTGMIGEGTPDELRKAAESVKSKK